MAGVHKRTSQQVNTAHAAQCTRCCTPKAVFRRTNKFTQPRCVFTLSHLSENNPLRQLLTWAQDSTAACGPRLAGMSFPKQGCLCSSLIRILFLGSAWSWCRYILCQLVFLWFWTPEWLLPRNSKASQTWQSAHLWLTLSYFNLLHVGTKPTFKRRSRLWTQ